MNIQERREIIESTNGKIFSVVFLKKDNTERHLTGRLKVVKGLRGGVSTTKHLDNIITVWDMQAKAYRNIDITRLVSGKIGKQEIVF